MDDAISVISASDRDVIERAQERVAAYADKDGEIKISCKDCPIMYVHRLLEIIDALEEQEWELLMLQK